MIPPTIHAVQSAVEKFYGLSHTQLVGPRRCRELARPRQIAMALCVDLLPQKSLPQIGRAFNRDHTTVMHARDTVAAMVEADQEFKGHLMAIEDEIRGSHEVSGEARRCALKCAEDITDVFRRTIFTMAERDPDEFLRRISLLTAPVARRP